VTLWIARPRLFLPPRMEQQQEDEWVDKRFRKRFWIAGAIGLFIITCNSTALWAADAGMKNLSIVAAMMAGMPTAWLIKEAVFKYEPVPYDDAPVSNHPEIILPWQN
jgi:hypothetical protein